MDIRRTVRTPIPATPFAEIARHILGKRYDLSLVICGDALARRLNRTYRKKVYSANVLSFPYSKHEGEIFLNLRAAEREAKKYGTTARARLALLFVHACFHLKGFDHGVTMERRERDTLRKFNLS